MFYLRKQHICEVETRELFDHSLLKAACFQLRHFSSTEMSRGWRRTGGPPVISVASLVSLQYIRYEHMKMSFFWSTPHPMFSHGFHWLIRWSSEADQLFYMQHMRFLGTSRKQWENSLGKVKYSQSHQELEIIRSTTTSSSFEALPMQDGNGSRA